MVPSLLLLPDFTGGIRPIELTEECGKLCLRLSQLPALENLFSFSFSFFFHFSSVCEGYIPIFR